MCGCPICSLNPTHECRFIVAGRQRHSTATIRFEIIKHIDHTLSVTINASINSKWQNLTIAHFTVIGEQFANIAKHLTTQKSFALIKWKRKRRIKCCKQQAKNFRMSRMRQSFQCTLQSNQTHASSHRSSPIYLQNLRQGLSSSFNTLSSQVSLQFRFHLQPNLNRFQLKAIEVKQKRLYCLTTRFEKQFEKFCLLVFFFHFWFNFSLSSLTESFTPLTNHISVRRAGRLLIDRQRWTLTFVFTTDINRINVSIVAKVRDWLLFTS